jgi:hypothetical protein
MSVLIAADAGATPLAQGKLTAETSDVVQVRDGCGRGYRYSNRAGRCVPEGGVWGGGGCPWGYHWSNRRGRCVPN